MRKLSLIMAVMMAITSAFATFSFNVFASGDNEALVIETNTEYATLEAALDAVASGQTIKLLVDVNIESTSGIIINSNKNITVDGDGHTITSTISKDNRATFYVQSGSLTLKNLKMDVTLTHSGAWGAVISRNAGTVITFDGCDIRVDGTGGESAIGVNTNGKVVIKNSEIRCKFPVFLDYAGNAVFEAENSSAKATSLGKNVSSVSGLSFIQSSTPMEDDPTQIETAKIGSNIYYSLPEAFAAAKDGDTIKLLTDIDVTATGSAGRIKCCAGGIDLTLDGNGKTVTGVADVTLAIHYEAGAYEDNGGALNLTIKNLTIDNKVNNSSSTGTALQVNTSTNVTLVDTTVTSGASQYASVIVQASGRLILADGSKIAPREGCALMLNGANAGTDIYGGAIEADSIVYTRNAAAQMNVCQEAEIVAKKEFVSSKSTKGMILNILGGHIKSENSDSGAITIPNDTDYKVNILGGHIEGGKELLTNKANATAGIAYPSGKNYVDYNMTVSKEPNIRFAKNSCGLRFETLIPAELIKLIESVKDSGTELGFGTVITPADSLKVTNGIFDISVLGSADIKGTNYIRIAAKNGIEKAADGSVTIRASLVNLKTENYNRDFAAAGFISFVMDGTMMYVYSDVGIQNAVDSARAIADTQGVDDERMKILENYANGVLNHDPSAIGGDTAPLTEITKDVLTNTDTVFKTVGRTYTRNGGLACDFSCTGIEFNAYCEGDIYLNVRTTAQAYLTVYIDGVRSEERISVTASEPWVRVAYDLDRGEHTVMIVKQSQFNMATLILDQVKISGEFKDKPADRELFLEFYGDSILNGSNVYGGGTSVKTSDATYGFGWIASQALGADCNIIGHGGLGVVKSKNAYNMVDLYKLAGSARLTDVPEYDFARTPDAVIIELGINDYVNGGLKNDPDTYAEGVRTLIANLRAKYGKDVPIVWMYGYRSDAKDFWTTTKATLDSIIAEGDGNIHYCKVSTHAAVNDNYHPDVNTAKIIGKDVAVFLKDLLNIS